MESFPEDSYYLKCMKTILDSYPQHSPPLHPTRLTDQFYIGNQDNADDVDLLRSLEITHVLNCAGTRTFDLTRSPYPPNSGIKRFLMIPAQDYDEYNIMQHFDDAIGFLDSAILGGGKAVVHCSIGVNRSGAVAAAYLMISQKKCLLDVIVELKAKRLLILCNMGFRKQLVQFARANRLLDKVETIEIRRTAISDLGTTAPQEPSEKEGSTADQKNEDAKPEKSDESSRKEATGERPGGPIDEDKKKLESKEPIQTNKLVEYMPKKYVYKTKAFTTETGVPTSNGSSNRKFKNVDSDIVLKLINESYNKYKQSSKLKDCKTPHEIKTSTAKHLDISSQPYTNLDFKSKSTEKELAKEVDDFLKNNKKCSNKQSGAGTILDSLISKEDERLIWGKGSLENDREFLEYRDKLEKSGTHPSDVTSVTSARVKPLDLVRKYQEKTNREISRDLQELISAPIKRTFTKVPATRSFKPLTTNKHLHDLDCEVDEYLDKRGRLPQTTFLPSSSTKDEAVDVLRRLSSSSSSNIKPISFYKLQVMTEKKGDDADLRAAADHYLYSANGHTNVLEYRGFPGAAKHPATSFGHRSKFKAQRNL